MKFEIDKPLFRLCLDLFQMSNQKAIVMKRVFDTFNPMIEMCAFYPDQIKRRIILLELEMKNGQCIRFEWEVDNETNLYVMFFYENKWWDDKCVSYEMDKQIHEKKLNKFIEDVKYIVERTAQ